ncbi:MAG: iron export ABC transporter permease subunit FetB [Rhodospirillaceae bacterium]|nr:iron export ABC transporter permease subunit FetB [Rhodospirillaceae bacterium]
MNFISLGYGDLVLASLLLLFSGVLSIRLRLGLEKQIGIAALRMVIQLFLIGMVLKLLFQSVSPLWTAIAAAVMVGFAGREAAARQTRKFTGWWTYGLGTSSLMLAGTIVTVLALTTQIRPDPWFDPRFAIPILGMIMGNTMNGVSIGLDRLLGEAVREKVALEARLALGHDRTRAFRPLVRNAVRAGLMNIINAMSAAGLVSLPGMMTGQILAGIDPTEAVKYQILIMFLIAGSTGLGTLAAVMFAVRRLTDSRHRLRLDHLRVQDV